MNIVQRFLTRFQQRPAPNAAATAGGVDVLPAASAAPTDPVRVIPLENLDELDRMIAEVEQAYALSFEAGREKLLSFRCTFTTPMPADPYSPEYNQAQMELYKRISGRTSYDAVVNENSPFDLEIAKRQPYPYTSGNAEEVGTLLICYGFLLKTMGPHIQPRARLVEFGAGWGHVALQLALADYQVTAVDVEPNFAALIRHRAAQHQVMIDVVQQDMLQFRAEEPFDAAIFCESFHHCADHQQLLRNLWDVVKPDGILVFQCEPLADFPHPWGFVRLDSIAIWSIRKYGWFELGFDQSYFLRTLLLFGWLPQRYQAGFGTLTDCTIARKATGLYEPHRVTLPPDEAATWSAPEPEHRFTAGRAVMSCRREQGPDLVVFCVSNFAPMALETTFGAGTSRTQVRIPKSAMRYEVRVPAKDWNGQIVVESPTWNPSKLFGNTDNRSVGIAVHWFRLVDGTQYNHV